MFELAESFLREEPCNVIAVDWNSPNGGIEQAAANGRLVAAEIGLLLEYIRVRSNVSGSYKILFLRKDILIHAPGTNLSKILDMVWLQ